MEQQNASVLKGLIERVFPKTADFFGMLTEQCVHAAQTSGLLVEFMESADAEIGAHVRRDEHEGDVVKVRNIHTLNEAFSTPIDREDIYRAITDLDDVVNYCKTTVNEMDMLGVTPDAYDLEMAQRLKDGVDALARGYAKLGKSPAEG